MYRQMSATRDQIVGILRTRGESTVAALAREVGVVHTAMRRHLEILAAEGTVEHRAVRQAAGRPYFVYRLTEQAAEAQSTGYPRLVERLVHELAALHSEPSASGRSLLDTVFDQMSEHMAEQYRTRVCGDTLEERVRSLTDALRAEGIVDRWQPHNDGFSLSTSACPHRRAAMAAHELCTAEARAISLLLGTEVEQVARVIDGAACCEYVVRSAAPPDAVALTVLQ